MLKLTCFDLRRQEEWDRFYALFTAYLSEVCEEEEYLENLADLHDDALNRQLIEQTAREHTPYCMSRIELSGCCVGLISYFYREENRSGQINNFYVCPPYRNRGIGALAYRMAERCLQEMGATEIVLLPVKSARGFWARQGFLPVDRTEDGETVYRKALKESM